MKTFFKTQVYLWPTQVEGWHKFATGLKRETKNVFRPIPDSLTGRNPARKHRAKGTPITSTCTRTPEPALTPHVCQPPAALAQGERQATKREAWLIEQAQMVVKAPMVVRIRRNSATLLVAKEITKGAQKICELIAAHTGYDKTALITWSGVSIIKLKK
jgi:hypothetical protein